MYLTSRKSNMIFIWDEHDSQDIHDFLRGMCTPVIPEILVTPTRGGSAKLIM